MTERVRIWRRTLEHPRRDGSNWYEYSIWINAASHAFRKAKGLHPYAPIGRSREFTEFLRTFGPVTLDHQGFPIPF